eukprot:2497735-Rhodomonas_salina.1
MRDRARAGRDKEDKNKKRSAQLTLCSAHALLSSRSAQRRGRRSALAPQDCVRPVRVRSMGAEETTTKAALASQKDHTGERGGGRKWQNLR